MVQVLHNSRCRFLDLIRYHHRPLRCCRHLIMDISHKYRFIIILISALALGMIYYIFDPSGSVIFPKCPVMSITGFPCAGCGSQRAIHALLHLNIEDAIRYNFLVVLFLPILGILSFSSVFRKKFPKLYLLTHHHYIAFAFLFLIILWWVLRIIFHWYV